MSANDAETVFCFYRVIPGREKALLDLIWEHDVTLRKLALVTDTPMTVYRGSDEKGPPSSSSSSSGAAPGPWRWRTSIPKCSRCGSAWTSTARHGTAGPTWNFPTW